MKNRNYFKLQYLIPIIFLVFFLVPSAMAAYECPISYLNTTISGVADSSTPAIDTAGLISCCYQAADEPYGGISCRPEDDFLQEIGGVVSCETEANLISKAESQKDLDRVSFNCFTGSTPSTCRESWCPSGGTCIKDNNHPCPPAKNRNNICPGGCGTCDSDSVYCVANEAADPGIFIAQPAAYDYTPAVACQAKLYGPGGQTSENQDGSCKSTGKDVANFCDGSCTGCSEGYTESGRSRSACIPFAQRFIEILADGLAIVGGPDADGKYDYSDEGPDSIKSINLISDLSQALVWTDPSVPTQVKDLIAGCAVDEVPTWDGATWGCGGGGLWIEDDPNIYYNVGNVGIGTASPGAKLDVAGGIDIDDYIRHNGDEDTYMNFFADDTVTFNTDGNERLRINPNGTVGVAEKVTAWNGVGVRNIGFYHMQDDDTKMLFPANDAIRFITAGSNRIEITPTGEVGIGTSSPREKLDVNGYIGLEGKLAFRGNDSWLRLNQDGDFTSGTFTPGLFRAESGLNVGDDEGFYRNAEDVIRTGDSFIVDGNVGIGVTVPEERLHVSGKIRSDTELIISEVSPQIFFEDTTSGADDYWIHANSDKLYFLWDPDDDGAWDSPHPLYFAGRNAYFDSSTLVVDAVNNRIGIGTTNPYTKLEVYGGAISSRRSAGQAITIKSDADGAALASSSALTEKQPLVISNLWYGGFGTEAGETNIDFQVGQGISPITAMHIEMDGNVGIGTVNPSHNLTVESSDEETMRLIGPDSYGYGARLNFGDSDYVYLDEYEDDKLKIHALGGIYIDNDLYLAHDLEVTGYVNIDGPLYVDDNLTATGNITANNNTRGTCAWSSWISEEHSAYYCPDGRYVAGIECTGSYCDSRKVYCCEL